MNKILLLLILFITFGCNKQPIILTTNWQPSHNINGTVMIATSWGQSELCTGNLINNNAILTAAHCANFPTKDLYIIYNCINITHNSCKRVQVTSIHKYPGWMKEYVTSHDLAIMKTNELIPLPLAEISNKTKLPEGIYVKTAGFGSRNGKSGIFYVGKGRVFKDYDKEIVIKMQGELDPHPGDSGGPIMILEDNKFKIVGILSRAQISKENKYTGLAIYTKPIAYINWINEVINK